MPRAGALARTDAGKPKSEQHARKRAVRKMTKDLLRDLWNAWREAGGQCVIDTHTDCRSPLQIPPVL